MSWELNRVGDICKVKSGKRLPKGMSVQDEPTTRKYLRVTDLKSHVVDESDIKYISEDIFKLINRYTISCDDIYISIAGTIGKVGIIPASIDGISLTENCCKLTELNKSKIIQHFLLYYLRSYEGQSKMQAKTGGASQPKLAITRLKDILIPTPPIQTQKRIADILSAYDDLIENNLKRIKLLEQAAQNIYKEWFVNLRFPGHENTSINQETGLPEGFEEKSLSDLVSKITDGTHDSPKPKDKGFYLVTGKNINNGFLDFSNAYLISKEDHDKVQKRSFLELGDILYSNIGTIGSTTIVDQDFKYSCKNVIIFKPLEFHSFFLYCFLTNTHTKSLFLQGLAGSSQKFISLTYARGYKEIFPSTDSIVLFHNTVKDFFKQKKLLHVQNQKLKAARDILLPRLMNRTIEV